MTKTEMRKALKALGYQVKLSRRNGIRQAVQVTLVSRDRVIIEGGSTDCEAFEAAYKVATENK